MESARQLVGSWIRDSGIVLAIVTATVYLCVLFNQIGYQEYFNMPVEFIPLGLTTVLHLFCPFVVSLLLAISVFVVIISIISAASDYLLWRFFNQCWDGKSIPARLTQNPIIRGEMIGFAFFTVIALLVTFSHYLGKKNAEARDEFFVVNEYAGIQGTLVLFQFYDDYVITTPLDRSTREIEKKMYILKMSEMGKAPIVHEKVGQLKLKQ